MHIGINGWFLSKQYTGIGQYSANLVRSLAQLATDKHTLTVFLNSDCPADNMPESEYVDYHAIDKRKFANDIADILLFEYLVRKKALEMKLDILHTPYLCTSLLHGNSYKHVVTVHDVIPKIFTSYRGSFLRHQFMAHNEKHIGNADLIIADSANSKADIVKYLGVDQDLVKVVRIAADAVFRRSIDEAQTREVKVKYDLPERFIFYIGGFDFRKNVKTLLEAYAAARASGARDLLVLGGSFSPARKHLARGLVENVPEIAGALGIRDHVRLLGPVPQEDLPHIYRSARLFVYPSLYEGFGLPPLEAMSCGTPVLASNSSSIPEVVDRADLLFDPSDPAELAEKLLWLLGDEQARLAAGQWGLERSGEFNWSSTAWQTFELYRFAMSGCSSSERQLHS